VLFQTRNLLAVKPDRPPSRPQFSVDQLEQGALPGSIWADNRLNLVLPDMKIDIGNGSQAAKFLGQIFGSQDFQLSNPFLSESNYIDQPNREPFPRCPEGKREHRE